MTHTILVTALMLVPLRTLQAAEPCAEVSHQMLVVWASPGNLEQQGAGAVAMPRGAQSDAIVLGPDEGLLEPRGEDEVGKPYRTRDFSVPNPAYVQSANRDMGHLVDSGIVQAIAGGWGRGDGNSMLAGVDGIKQHGRNRIARHGDVDGQRARGDYRTDLARKPSQFQQATFRSSHGWPCTVRLGQCLARFPLQKGETLTPDRHLARLILREAGESSEHIMVGWTPPAVSQPPAAVPLTDGFVDYIKAAANPDRHGLRADGFAATGYATRCPDRAAA